MVGNPFLACDFGAGALTAGQRGFHPYDYVGPGGGDRMFLGLRIDPYDGANHFYRRWNGIESTR